VPDGPNAPAGRTAEPIPVPWSLTISHSRDPGFPPLRISGYISVCHTSTGLNNPLKRGDRSVPMARQFAVLTGMESGADALENSVGRRECRRFSTNGMRHQRTIENAHVRARKSSTWPDFGRSIRTETPGHQIGYTASKPGNKCCTNGTDMRVFSVGPPHSNMGLGWLSERKCHMLGCRLRRLP